MKKRIARREFLKTVPAAGAVAYAGALERLGAQMRKPADVRIGTAAYTPVPDYPIRPKRAAEVRINDRFWKPKLTTNSEVTIPFEMEKLARAERDFSINVLEAAILSLQTHSDPALEAQVEQQIRAMASQTWRGNTNFEVAAAYYHS